MDLFFSRSQTTRADRLVQGIGQNPKLPTYFPVELHIAFDCYQRHPECTRDLRLSRIAIDDQLSAKKPESRQRTLLMDKHRQMAVKVVYLAVPLLKGNLGVDMRDSRRKDRQLYLWHAQLLPHSSKKGSLLCPLLSEQKSLFSLPLPTYLLDGGSGVVSLSNPSPVRPLLKSSIASRSSGIR